eukprot:TRINITY_DN2307_c0_g1_i2.p1 TRINITY_DN2307_c0_g1~~TRINITY_DN2307_c0_g1_i2.p1  ORF type:complete len:425 (+),score=114.08 TRINITY_DN2307_c0_g1_i2:36-1310(+)
MTLSIDGSEASTIPPMVDFDDNLPLETDFFDFRVISAPPMFDTEHHGTHGFNNNDTHSFGNELNFLDDSNLMQSNINIKSSNFGNFNNFGSFGFENAINFDIDFAFPKRSDTNKNKSIEVENDLDESISETNSYSNEVIEEVIPFNNNNDIGDHHKKMIDSVVLEHKYSVIQNILADNNVELLLIIIPRVLSKIADDLLDDVVGQNVLQDLLEIASQNFDLLEIVVFCLASNLSMFCTHVIGTRIVQRLIDYCSNYYLIGSIIHSLYNDSYTLMQDTNAHHVMQKLFQTASFDYLKRLYDICIEKANSLSYNRHGCCVMQKALQYADITTKKLIVNKLKPSVRELVIHPFGNYVVQFIFNLATDEIELQEDVFEMLLSFQGYFVELSQQKCSSNVIEKTISLPYLDLESKKSHNNRIFGISKVC